MKQLIYVKWRVQIEEIQCDYSSKRDKLKIWFRELDPMSKKSLLPRKITRKQIIFVIYMRKHQHSNPC